MTKEEIIAKAYKVFNTFNHPLHFVDTQNSLECKDYEQMLQSCELHEIGPEQVGHAGWSPLPYLLPEALGYLMPRLIEMALNNMHNSDGEPFVLDFIRHLLLAPENQYYGFTGEQSSLTLAALNTIKLEMIEIVEFEGYKKDLLKLIDQFS